MANVGYIREEIKRMLDRWFLIRDCLSGQEAIKAAGDKYLPRPNAADTSEENLARYKQYLVRAVFYNVTQRTHAGLVGQVFQQDPIVELDPVLDAIKDDINGAGVSLDQQAKKALGLVLAYGRCGVFVDYPASTNGNTQADVDSGVARPTITLYNPWEVINWRTKKIGVKVLLTLVVIAEDYLLDDDGFEIKQGKQWRVLRLNEAGDYQVELWRFDNGAHIVYERFTPTDATGAPFKFIPFSFIGSMDNDPNVDLPPMYDLASLNVAHYRNSADYEESCYIVGQPTPCLAGLTKDWVEDVLKGQIQLGSRAAIPLPAGATFGLLQANPNSMPKEAMDSKEKQMIAIGAKLVEQSTTIRTATEARQDEASEVSILAACTKNVAFAYKIALAWCNQFQGGTVEPSFELNTDFEIGRMSANDRSQLLQEWLSGLISFEEARFNLRRANIAYLKDTEAITALNSEKNLRGQVQTSQS